MLASPSARYCSEDTPASSKQKRRPPSLRPAREGVATKTRPSGLAGVDGDEGETISGAEDMHHAIDRLMAQTFGHFLSRLDDYGILDQGISVWCSDLGNGVSHSYRNVPFILAGSVGGFLRTGRYVDFGGLYHNKLFNTIITAAGIRTDTGGWIEDFGDPGLEGGVLSELIA